MSYYVLEVKGLNDPERYISGIQRVALEGNNTQKGVYYFKSDGTSVIGYVSNSTTYYVIRSQNPSSALTYKRSLMKQLDAQYTSKECAGPNAQNILGIAKTLKRVIGKSPIG